MSLRQTSFEGPTPGTVLDEENSGGTNGDDFDLVAGNANATYSDTQAFDGTQSVLINVTGTVICLYDPPSGVDQGANRCYLYLNSYPSSTCSFLEIRNSGGTVGVAQLTGAGELRITDATSQIGRSPSALPLNSWVRIDLRVEVGSTTSDGVVEAAWSNGDGPHEWDTLDTTANTGTTLLTSFRSGKTTNGPSLDTYQDLVGADAGSAAFIPTPQSVSATDSAALTEILSVIVISDTAATGTLSETFALGVAASATDGAALTRVLSIDATSNASDIAVLGEAALVTVPIQAADSATFSELSQVVAEEALNLAGIDLFGSITPLNQLSGDITPEQLSGSIAPLNQLSGSISATEQLDGSMES